MIGQMAILLGMLASFIAMPINAQDDNSNVEDENTESDRVCVNARLIDNFDALTDEHVFVETRSEQYLFTMRRRCNGLHFSNGVALKDTTSRICSDGFGEIVYRDMGRLSSCGIEDIQVVDSKDAAEAIVQQQENEEE